MSDLAQSYEDIITALTVWREARGESEEARRGVLWVIHNRKHDKRWPDTLSEVCLQPMQFSCYNVGDPNATKYPKPNDASWLRCLAVCQSMGVSDPTLGANHYHSYGPAINLYPKWADLKKVTARIGAFTFYKL